MPKIGLELDILEIICAPNLVNYSLFRTYDLGSHKFHYHGPRVSVAIRTDRTPQNMTFLTFFFLDVDNGKPKMA